MRIGARWLASLALCLLAFSIECLASGNTQDAYGKLPLSFVANTGQVDASIRYVARTGNLRAAFTSEEVFLSLSDGKRRTVLALRFIGAQRNIRIEAARPLPGAVNYLIGSDRSQWKTNVPTFAEVVYHDLWPGIDLAFSGQDGKLKYEFRVAPGADPRRIRLAYRGADGLTLDEAGSMIVRTKFGDLRDERPVSFQNIDGEQVPVETNYVLARRATRNGYSFAVGQSYDRRYPLVIDPGLHYSTYLGGSRDDESSFDTPIAVDTAGNAYTCGYTDSSDFPTTLGSIDPTYNEGFRSPSDAFVTKLNAAGTALIYSTFLGGEGGDFCSAIVVDSAGDAFITGETYSVGFPSTPGAFDRGFTGSNVAFIAKLNPSGSNLLYSTRLGGRGFHRGHAIAIDSDLNAYVTGQTREDFPTTPGAFDTTPNISIVLANSAFVTKLNPSGSALVYSTYLGGELNSSYGYAIAVDAGGNAYVTGITSASDFPTTAGAFDTTLHTGPFNGGELGSDAFVTKLNPAGSALVYSTFLGSSGGDVGTGIAVDSAGHAYVTGGTGGADFPTTAGAFDQTHNGPFMNDNPNFFGADIFVTKLNPAGSALSYSTVIGGEASDVGQGIQIDAAGNAYIIGYTYSVLYPTTPRAFDSTFARFDPTVPRMDAVVTKLNSSGTALLYSTFLGGDFDDWGLGIAIDAAGLGYVSGVTRSFNFPTTAGAFDTTVNGGGDAFVTKLDFEPVPTAELSVTKTGSPDPVAPGALLTYVVNVINAGPDEATGVTLIDTLPSESTFESVSSSEWGCSSSTQAAGQLVTCTRAFVPVGTSTINIVVRVKSGTPDKNITNLAAVGAASPRDTRPNDDRADIRTAVRGPAADLSVVVTDSPDPVTAGETLTYLLTVRNIGPEAASNVTMIDTLPPETLFESASGAGWSCTPSTGPAGPLVTCTRASLAVSTSTITIVARVKSDTRFGQLFNTARVSAVSPQDRVAGNNSVNSLTVVEARVLDSDLSISATDSPDPVSAGGTVIWVLTVGNNGPDPASQVGVHIQAFGGMVVQSITSSAGWTCESFGGSGLTFIECVGASLAKGTTATINISSRVDDGPGVQGLVDINSENRDPNGANNSVTIETRVSAAGGNNPPVAVCRNIQVPAGATCLTSITPGQVDAGSSDPDGDAITLSLSPTGPFGPGVHAVTLTATDTRGASNSCVATVTVTDTTPPAITAAVAVNLVTGSDAASCSAVVSDALMTATASDTCAGVTVTRSGVPAGNLFPLGATTVTYTATDAAGNKAVATQVVTVLDNTPPSITAASAVNLATGPAAATCSAFVSDALLTATASDNCAGVTVTRSGVPAGNLFPLGATTVTYKATDAAGNKAVATQLVTVADSTPPSITAASAVNLATGPDAITCSAVVSDTLLTATASDNCAGVSVTRSSVPAGNLFPLGATIVTYTATDAAGNSAAATQVVTVVDNTPPKIACPAPVRVEFANANGAIVTYPSATATDNCSGATASCLPLSGSVFPIGTTSVVCTGADGAGNRANCSFTVTVTGAQGTKRNILSELISLRATVTGKGDEKDLDDAIEHLQKSLEPALWVDDTHVDAKGGDEVFKEEKQAAQNLQHLLNDKKSLIAKAVLQGLIDRIVNADRLLARVAINDAVAAGGDATKISQANDAMEKAERDVAASKYESGIEHYRLAWDKALQSVTKRDNDD